MVCSFGSYWQVQDSVGLFTDRCSPPNGRAAARILRDEGLAAAAELAESWGVATAVESIEKLVG